MIFLKFFSSIFKMPKIFWKIFKKFKKFEKTQNFFEFKIRYGDPDDVPPAPAMPDWCFEDADLDERDDSAAEARAELAESVAGDAKKPFVPDFDMPGVSLVKGEQSRKKIFPKVSKKFWKFWQC